MIRSELPLAKRRLFDSRFPERSTQPTMGDWIFRLVFKYGTPRIALKRLRYGMRRAVVAMWLE